MVIKQFFIAGRDHLSKHVLLGCTFYCRATAKNNVACQKNSKSIQVECGLAGGSPSHSHSTYRASAHVEKSGWTSVVRSPPSPLGVNINSTQLYLFDSLDRPFFCRMKISAKKCNRVHSTKKDGTSGKRRHCAYCTDLKSTT